MNVDLSFIELDEEVNGRNAYGVYNEITEKAIGVANFNPRANEYVFILKGGNMAITANGMAAVSEFLSHMNEGIESYDERIDQLIGDINSEIDSLNSQISELNMIIDSFDLD